MSIDELRARIDKLDAEIVRLINSRADLASQIGKLKEQNSGIVYAPEREEQILRRVENLGQGILSADAVRAIYTEIISACRALERRPRVAYHGPEGKIGRAHV